MSYDRTRLSDDALDEALATTPDWRRDGDRIRRDFELADFDRAMDLINAVADVARELDHHAELSNVYNRVSLEVTTHDAGGLTVLDFEFARRVDALGY